MVINFPAIVKTQDVLNLEQLVFEIKEGTLVEAALPNWTLSYQWEYLVFDGGKDDKRAVIPAQMTQAKLAKWIEGLLPVETEEEREERLRWEQENELRAAGLEETCYNESVEPDFDWFDC